MSNEDDKKAILRAILHHAILMVFALIVIFAVGYAYYSIKVQGSAKAKMPVRSQSNGAAHPLPDFIVDKVNPDELEQLKP